MAVTYYAILTNIGAGKLANATALGTTLKISHLAVGDGGGSLPTPDASRTGLVNEVRRAPLNSLSVDPKNGSQIIAEQVIPEDVGGWWIREMGLYDDSGALIAYANCAPSYKPQLSEGSGRTQTVRMVLVVSSTGAVELKIDPSVVLATREYVDLRMKSYAPLGSPFFVGNPKAPTLSVSDRSSSIATTEFVRRAQGSCSGTAYFLGDAILEAADIGKVIVAGASPAASTWTPPDMDSLPVGSSFEVVNFSGFPVNLVQRRDGDVYLSPENTQGSAKNYLVANGTSVKVTKYQEKMWVVSSVSPAYPKSFSPAGYVKQPSGLIIQWMAVGLESPYSDSEVLLPIAFPNAGLSVVASYVSSLGRYAGRCGASFVGLSRLKVSNAVPELTGIQTLNIIAIGY